MSIGAVAFWSSDYALAILETKNNSFPLRGCGEDENLSQSESKKGFLGIKPRNDEYISSMQNKKFDDDVSIEENTVGKIEKKGKDAEFSQEEQKIINDLKVRDQEVRNHEQAHIAAGGAYIRGGASYSYQSGPDGKQYAIDGEVSIDASPVKDNYEATIAKMQTVRAAALAPASPSGQDRAVAAAASQTEARARADMREERAQKLKEENDEDVKDKDDNFLKTSKRALSAISAYNVYDNPSNISTINFAA
ncbi:MAG: hypothetical protein LBH98_05740 [Chitinispirillales bacterium]|jgi:hypothetical protein|nr:hypothetical protein [Chitinispirillales bacterium]